MVEREQMEVIAELAATRASQKISKEINAAVNEKVDQKIKTHALECPAAKELAAWKNRAVGVLVGAFIVGGVSGATEIGRAHV